MPAGPRPRPPVRSIRVAHTGDISGLPWAAIQWIHADGASDITGADLNALATFVGNSYGSNIISHMDSATRLTHTHVSLYSADLDLLEGDAAFSLAGSVVGLQCPAQVCIGISWHVTVGYRGGHPRTYVPGVPISMLSAANTVGGTFASSLAAGATTYLSNVNGYTTGAFSDGIHLGTMSFVRARAWRTPPVFLRFISATVDERLDTQRRRLGPDIS